MPLESTCDNESGVPVAYKVKTPRGNAAKIDGGLRARVVSGDPTAFAVIDPGDPDGLTVNFFSSDVPGDVTFVVEGDADLSHDDPDTEEQEGVKLISDTFTLHVTGAEAAAFDGVIGASIPKPERPL